MKKIIYLSTIFFLFTNVTANDDGLHQLRQSFSNLIKSSGTELDKAAEMKPVLFDLDSKEEKVSTENCKTLEKTIKSNYTIDPFEFTYANGSITRKMCATQRWEKNYLLQKSGVTNQGLDYTTTIQLRFSTTKGYQILNYFVDSSFHIVEIQSLSTSKKMKDIFSYRITSINKDGDIYISDYVKNLYIISGMNKFNGANAIQMYIPADGSSPNSLYRSTLTTDSDPSKYYQVLSWSRSDKNDWENFETSITHQQGYYVYDGKYYSHDEMPNYKSSLTIKYKNGQEICAYGNVQSDKKLTFYPASNVNDYYDCFNYSGN